MSAFHTVEVTDGLMFAEGPVALPSGDIVVGEMATGNLVQIAPDGTKSIAAHTGGSANGLARGYDGRIFVANSGGVKWRWVDGHPHSTGLAPEDYRGGRIEAVDLASGEVEVVATAVDGQPLAGPNDLVFDADGNLYFTDMGKRIGRRRLLGGLYYLPRGAREAISLAFPLDTPNGIALSPDGRRIYVTETSTARIWTWEIDSPGVLRPGHTQLHAGHGTLLCTVPGYCALDSMAIDSRERLCVATLYQGAITIVSPDGAIETTVHMPEHDTYLTNLCFGGPDLRTAFVTSATIGKLWAVKWPCPGIELNFAGHRGR